MVFLLPKIVRLSNIVSYRMKEYFRKFYLIFTF
jgi:hypothetical protein